MPLQNTQINKFLEALGLDSREIEAYLSLLDNGIMTALELSRRADIPRTTLYRVIES